VTEATTQTELNDLKPTLVLENHCDARVLTQLISKYAMSLPKGEKVSRNSTTHGFGGTKTEIADDITSTKKESSLVQLERVESQIDRIVSLFGKGNDQPAHSVLSELIDSQTIGVTDHSHVVKSLCNIASKCSAKGRTDINIHCLSKALEFESGIDAILYSKIGNALTDVREFDRAVICYQKALDRNPGERRESILLNLIRLERVRGDYDKALQQYLDFPDLKYKPSALFGLATLYRRMGRLRDARETYEAVLHLDQDDHKALAGLAESVRQNGKHYKALKRYKAILRSSVLDLDEGAFRAYSLALSQLYQVTDQLVEAESCLKELESSYPMDCAVQLELAKLYQLTNKPVLAREHFLKSQGPNLNQLAAKLYLTAIGELRPSLAVSETDTRPEDLGLLACYEAMNAIECGQIEAAKDAIDTVNHVDRLHADFAAVLGFHATLLTNPDFNYKSDRVLCRIARRGYKHLKVSIRHLADGDFDNARICERRVCFAVW